MIWYDLFYYKIENVLLWTKSEIFFTAYFQLQPVRDGNKSIIHSKWLDTFPQAAGHEVTSLMSSVSSSFLLVVSLSDSTSSRISPMRSSLAWSCFSSSSVRSSSCLPRCTDSENHTHSLPFCENNQTICFFPLAFENKLLFLFEPISQCFMCVITPTSGASCQHLLSCAYSVSPSVCQMLKWRKKNAVELTAHSPKKREKKERYLGGPR